MVEGVQVGGISSGRLQALEGERERLLMSCLEVEHPGTSKLVSVHFLHVDGDGDFLSHEPGMPS